MAKGKKDFMGSLKAKIQNLPQNALTGDFKIKSNIIILPTLRDLIPPLKTEELDQLESNTLEYGIKDPLTLWETDVEALSKDLDKNSQDYQAIVPYLNENVLYVLIDGHNRYGIAKRNNLDFRINISSFDNLEKVRDYMIDYQLGRRNLTSEQASYLRGLKYNKIKEEVGPRADFNISEKLAEEFGVNTRTIHRDSKFAKGIEKLEPELKTKVLSGETSITKSEIIEIANDLTVEDLVNEETIIERKSLKSVPSLSPKIANHNSELDVIHQQTPEELIKEIKVFIEENDLYNKKIVDELKRMLNFLKSKI